MWDRVPIKGAPPPREDGLADPEEAPHVVHSNYVQFLSEPPAACVLHPPMVNLHVSWSNSLVIPFSCFPASVVDTLIRSPWTLRLVASGSSVRDAPAIEAEPPVWLRQRQPSASSLDLRGLLPPSW